MIARNGLEPFAFLNKLETCPVISETRRASSKDEGAHHSSGDGDGSSTGAPEPTECSRRGQAEDSEADERQQMEGLTSRQESRRRARPGSERQGATKRCGHRQSQEWRRCGGQSPAAALGNGAKTSIVATAGAKPVRTTDVGPGPAIRPSFVRHCQHATNQRAGQTTPLLPASSPGPCTSSTRGLSSPMSPIIAWSRRRATPWGYGPLARAARVVGMEMRIIPKDIPPGYSKDLSTPSGDEPRPRWADARRVVQP